MITFQINGRTVNPNNIRDALEQAMLSSIEKQLRQRIGSIRDPETGEFPTLVVSGPNLEELTIKVEGSPELISLVKARLGGDDEADDEMKQSQPDVPKAFLSFTWDDKPLAEKIATVLMQNGIDTFWAPWCIGPGDSFRKKINEGLDGCTHFIVLLTPNSIDKPWVNQEMDAGLFMKLNEGRKFIALRHNLSVNKLPKLLVGSLAPEVNAENLDVTELVNGIWGISSKPRLGTPPAAVAEAKALKTGYSAAATAVAKVFVESTKTARFADPQMSVDQLSEATNLPRDDVEDALHELSGMVRVSLDHVLVEDELFVVFDKHWMSWDPAKDALTLATDLINSEEFPRGLKDIAQRYEWEPRRLNPAVAYLSNRKIIRDVRAIGGSPWLCPFVHLTTDTRRFVKSRS